MGVEISSTNTAIDLAVRSANVVDLLLVLTLIALAAVFVAGLCQSPKRRKRHRKNRLSNRTAA
jgi:hypothetical protein